LEAIASILGSVSGIISLLGVVYFFAFWRGQVDNDRRAFRESMTNYPPAEMWTMVKTLWDVYVMDALRHRPDLAEHGSGFKLKEEGHDLIPDYMKPLLDNIPHNPSLNDDIATGYLVVKHIGLEKIVKMSEEKGLSIQETIAVLSTYLEEAIEHNSK
jgi:hypothetical protein